MEKNWMPGKGKSKKQQQKKTRGWKVVGCDVTSGVTAKV